MSGETRRGEAERLRDVAQRAGADEGDITRSGRRWLLQGGRGFSRKAGIDLGELVPVRRVWCGFTRGRDGRPARAYRLVRGSEILDGVFTERSGARLRRWFEREARRPDRVFFAGLPLDSFIRNQHRLDRGLLSFAGSENCEEADRDFLSAGGWHIESHATGVGAGRPPQPPTAAERIHSLLEQQRPRYPIDQMKTTLACRGRKPAAEAAMYAELGRVVAAAMSGRRRGRSAIQVESLAEFLGCTPNTVYRLRAKGREVQKNSPKGEGLRPSTYWAFRDWTPSVDPRDPFKVLYAPPARTAAVIDLQNRGVPVLREEAA